MRFPVPADRLILSRMIPAAIKSILLAIGLLGVWPVAADESSGGETYRLIFETDLTREDGTAGSRITVVQDANLLREVRLRVPAALYSNLGGDGDIQRDGAVVTWRPPSEGGSIRYDTAINHIRENGSFDAIRTGDWTVFRGDNLFPPASIRQRAGAKAVSELVVRLPPDWSIVTPFAADASGRFVVENPERIFDRPVGWFVAGKLGVRKDMISGIEVSVAGPTGIGIERLGMLALLRWNLPLLAAELDTLPARISIVSAGDPMWRGGLSAPNSLFIHSERPLISENATSPLLHEIVHVLLPVDTKSEHDWIDEGIAEYVGLELMHRSGTISSERFRATLEKFRRRGRKIESLSADRSFGDRTARAVDIFHRADEELRAKSEGRSNLYDLIRLLMESDRPVDPEALQDAARTLTGGAPIAAFDLGH